MDYLGQVISRDGVKVDPTKISTMLKWPKPTNLKALREFIRLIGYCGKFIRGYGLIADLLSDLLQSH